MSISLIPLLLVVALFVVLPLLVAFGFAVEAIANKNWKSLKKVVLIASGILMILSFAGFLLIGGVAGVGDINEAYKREMALQIDMQSTRTAPTPPPAPLIVDPDVTIAISVLSLFALAALLGLAILTVVLIRKRRFGVLLATLGGVGVVMTALFYVGFSPFQPIKSVFVDTFNAERLSNQFPIARPVAPSEPTAEVASDEELASIASAPPKIELDSEIVIGDKAEDAKSDRPDWIDAHLGDNQKLITSGPFTTKESCELDTQKQITEWLWNRHEELWPSGAGKFPGFGTDVTQAIKSQHEELRDTSVGEMHILYTLAEVTPEVEAQIAKSLAEAAAQIAQKRGARAITFTGVGVLSLVALTHVVLRSGGRRAKSQRGLNE